MSTILAAAFVLVTVAQGGTVSSSYYQSMSACEEAKSIATTGETVEQLAAIATHEAKIKSDFEAAHPPRAPKDEIEKYEADHGDPFGYSDGFHSFTVTADRLIQEEPFSLFNQTNTLVQSGDIGRAACFEDKGDKL